MNIEDLQTGDIVLISNTENGIFNWFLNLIRYTTHSNYVHIGMIVKDPSFLDTPLKGTYLWESSYEGSPDPQDNKIKLGVQLTDILSIRKNYPNAFFYVRRLYDNTIFTNDKLKEIHDVVHNIPYDIHLFDWIMAFFRKDITPQKTSRFWCSALVGYFYTKIGVLNNTTDWSIMYPSDFGLESEKLNYLGNNRLLPEEKLLKLTRKTTVDLSKHIEGLNILCGETEV